MKLPLKDRKTLADRLSLHGEHFTTSDTLIGDYLLSNYPKSLLQNASELAESLHLNITTITRFFTKLGYTSAKEAMLDFKEELEFIIDSPKNRYDTSSSMTNGQGTKLEYLLQLEQQNVANTINNIDITTLDEVTRLLLTTKDIFVLGSMKEFSLAYYLHKQLSILRPNVRLFNGQSEELFMCDANSDAVYFVTSFRRYARQSSVMAQYAKRVGAVVIAITDSRFCPMAQLADYRFVVTTQSATMFDSYTAGMTLINAIMMHFIGANNGKFAKRLDAMEDIYASFGMFESK